LVAVSVKSRKKNAQVKKQSSPPQPQQPPSSSEKLQKSQLLDYFMGKIQDKQDPVLSFHYKPKAGLKTGAKFVQEIENARPADTNSLGYCVLVKYPELNTSPTINPKTSPGTQLVEAALLYAHTQDLKKVYAYSRPAGLSGQ